MSISKQIVIFISIIGVFLLLSRYDQFFHKQVNNDTLTIESSKLQD
ncbi:hypothetical protein [Acinetobacter sp.]|jgi:hypothetical protein|nr:hypothetical protein [Acinetobacter sp.]MDR0236886.1 hypothetical protein [Acinetobacter sp.]